MSNRYPCVRKSLAIFPQWLLLCLLLVYGAASIAQPLDQTVGYVNEEVGVRIALADDWNVYTSRETAPQMIKPNFPADKGPNDSPLFIAVHDNQQLFAQLVTETFFGHLNAYGQLLRQGLEAQGLKVLSSRLASDGSALEVIYEYPLLAQQFRDTISLLQGSTIIRLSTWTGRNTFAAFQADIDALVDAAQLHGVIQGGQGWQFAWTDLGQRLLADERAAKAVASIDPAALRCENPGDSLLWQVEREDREVYLFGSIHVGKEAFYPLPEVVENAFQEAEFLVLEIDPRSAADPEVVQEIQRRGMLPAGQSLHDVVSAEVVQNLRKVMADMRLPAEGFLTMQPWMLNLVLANLQINLLGYSSEHGVENYFLSRKPSEMEILELETIWQQIGFLEALNAEAFLAYALEGFSQGQEEVESLMTAWRCADKDALQSLLLDDFSDSALPREEMQAFMDEMIYARNIHMADAVEGFIEKGAEDYFVVVGAAHLLGEGSVIDLLREAGYRVNPVPL